MPDPSDCPLNPIVPVDANAKILLNMIPEPNVGLGADSFFAGNVGQPMRWREELVRLDHDFNSKERATFRLIHDSWDVTNATVTWGGENFPTIGTHFVGPGVSIVADGYQGRGKMVVDEDRRVIVGATLLGQDVGELIHSFTIAIVGEVPLERLWHAVPSFPTMSEIWLRLMESYGL